MFLYFIKDNKYISFWLLILKKKRQNSSFQNFEAADFITLLKLLKSLNFKLVISY